MSLPSIGAEAFRDCLMVGRPLLDVRAPVEFAQGAFPAAINLPLLNDEERHAVGVRYKQAGQHSAITLGHQLVSGQLREARIHGWQQWAKVHPDGALYCFRGGLRSRTVQQWLAEAGYIRPRIEGGYKAMRRFLINAIPEELRYWQTHLLGGRTGTGKTHLLKRVHAHVDLEGLARHRGSSFGRLPQPQPSTIDFEHALAIRLMQLRGEGACASPLLLEDEGRMIGRICLPGSLRAVMDRAPILLLDVSMAERVESSLGDYVHDLLANWQLVFMQDDAAIGLAICAAGIDQERPANAMSALHAHHRHALHRVQKRLGSKDTRRVLAMLDAAVTAHRRDNCLDGWREYIQYLLERYYDPMYDYQLKRKADRVVFTGDGDAIIEWLARSRSAA